MQNIETAVLVIIYRWLSANCSNLNALAMELLESFCSKTCLATVLIRSIFAPEKLHERFSASAVFQRKIERINTVARHVLL